MKPPTRSDVTDHDFASVDLSDVLAISRVADCFSWSRDISLVSIQVDDFARDVRTCVEVWLGRDSSHVEVRRLTGFDAVRNRWTDYVGPRLVRSLSSRRGEKALRAWIESQCLAKHRQPNPPQLCLFRQSTTAAAAA